MRLQELHLSNFRCFKDVHLKFSTPYTILIGNNGSGKSAILSAIQIVLSDFVNSALLDMRQGLSFVGNDKIQVSDVSLETVHTGSTLSQRTRHPLAINVLVSNSNELLSWERHLSESDLRFLEPLARHVQQIQQRLSQGEPVILPVVAYYGTQRQWGNSDASLPNSVSFLPQMNGYINALEAKPFNIKWMRHWFSKMLLISRKKPVPEFEAVRRAIASCYQKIDERPSLKSVIIDYDAEKEDIEIQMHFEDEHADVLPLSYLSDGTKSVLAIVADIAYRMAVLNPHLLERVVSETDGIVLIDELDMHLHPAWQRNIIRSLTDTFPNVQFLVTTHSPMILTNVPKENIILLNDGQIIRVDTNTYGRDVNSMLREVMSTDVRPSNINDTLSAFSDAISRADLACAGSILDSLRPILGDNDAEIIGAQITLDLERL